MTDRARLKEVTAWLADLANLTAGNAPLADSKTKIAALASLLADDYPPDAFTRQSLASVAGKCRFFPAYSEICTHLGAWWRDHRPTPIAIAPPVPAWKTYDIPKPRDPATEEELEYTHEIIEEFRMDMFSKRLAASLAEEKAKRPAAVMSDRQVLATYEATGQGESPRAAALRAKLASVSA